MAIVAGILIGAVAGVVLWYVLCFRHTQALSRIAEYYAERPEHIVEAMFGSAPPVSEPSQVTSPKPEKAKRPRRKAAPRKRKTE